MVVVYQKKQKNIWWQKGSHVGGRVGEETKVKIQKEKEEKNYKEKVSLFAGKNKKEQRK